MVSDVLALEKESSGVGVKAVAKKEVVVPEKAKPPTKPVSSLFIAKAVKQAPRPEAPKAQASLTEDRKGEVVARGMSKEDLLLTCCELQSASATALADTAHRDLTRHRVCSKTVVCLDLVSKITGLNPAHFNRAAETNTLVSSFLKDYGYVAIDLLLSVARLIKYSASSLEDVAAGVEVLEALVSRGLKSKVLYGPESNAVTVRHPHPR
jgi:hypothetical protein